MQYSCPVMHANLNNQFSIAIKIYIHVYIFSDDLVKYFVMINKLYRSYF